MSNHFKENTLSKILITIVIIFCFSILIYAFYMELSSEKIEKKVEIKVVGVNYEPAYTTYSWNAALKTMTPMNHPADYKTYFSYDGYDFYSSLQSVYLLSISKVNTKVKARVIKVIYKDGTVRYDFKGYCD